MIVWLLVAFTLAFALFSLYTLSKAFRASISHTWPAALLGLSMSVFIYLYGTWIYLSYYVKYAFGITVLLIIIIALFRRKTGRVPKRRLFANIFFTLILSTLSVLFFTGTTGKPQTVELEFPLKTGKYFVLQGGKGLPANVFHYSYRGAVYAMDIVKLDDYGRRANGVFTPKLEDYYIFNDTVFSPCSGRIINVRNDNPDNTPPVRKRGPSNLNAVVIDADSFYVFIGHLKKGSVLVTEEQEVKAGQPIAQVGNSGFSLEPHLHIQVHRKTGSERWYRGEPLYINFDGQTYLAFEVIRPKKVDMVNN
jgi:hypothetical protein